MAQPARALLIMKNRPSILACQRQGSEGSFCDRLARFGCHRASQGPPSALRDGSPSCPPRAGGIADLHFGRAGWCCDARACGPHSPQPVASVASLAAIPEVTAGRGTRAKSNTILRGAAWGPGEHEARLFAQRMHRPQTVFEQLWSLAFESRQRMLLTHCQ